MGEFPHLWGYKKKNRRAEEVSLITDFVAKQENPFPFVRKKDISTSVPVMSLTGNIFAQGLRRPFPAHTSWAAGIYNRIKVFKGVNNVRFRSKGGNQAYLLEPVPERC